MNPPYVQPFTLGEVRSLYNQARQVGMPEVPLWQFAEAGNAVTGTNAFGLGDTRGFGGALNVINQDINDALELSGANRVGADVGGFMGRIFGNEELGRQVGESLPRGVVNTLPMLIPGVGWAGAAGAALLGGMDVYGQTQSMPRAVLGGVATGAMPWVIGKASGAMLNNSVGNALMQRASTGVPAAFGTNLVASFGADVAADFGDIALAPERSFSEVLTPEYWQTRAIANTAFVPLDAYLAVHEQRKFKLEQENTQKQIDNIITDLQGRAAIGESRVKVPEEAEIVLPDVVEDTATQVAKVFGLPYTPSKSRDVKVNELPFDNNVIELGFDETGALAPIAAKVEERANTSALKVVEEIANTEPKNAAEALDQLDTINKVREMEGEAPVSAVEVEVKANRLEDLGVPTEEAVVRAVQATKNAEVTKRKNKFTEGKTFSKETEDAINLFESLRTDDKLNRHIDLLQKRLIKYEGNYELQRAIVREWDGWFNNYKEVGFGSYEGLLTRVNNAQKRLAARKGESAQKVGRKTKTTKAGKEVAAREGLEGLSDVELDALGRQELFDKINALDDNTKGALMRGYQDFMRLAETKDVFGNSDTFAMRTLAKFVEEREAGKKPNAKVYFKNALANLERDQIKTLVKRGETRTEAWDKFEAPEDREADRIANELEKQQGFMRVSAQDSEYLAAVERGDMETAQRMVDEAARRTGYRVEAWHGTPKGGFTKFKPGSFGPLFFFAKEKQYADYYAARFVDAPSPTTLHVYLRMENPKNMESVGQQEDKLLAYRTRKEGFDSIETPNAYVVFIDDQIKSADPVTRDADGNVIPLSQRFDSTNADIRYMRYQAAQRTKSNYSLPVSGIRTSRVGKADGLFYGSNVKGTTTKILPTVGENVLTLRHNRLDNEGDAGNAPLAELFDSKLLSIDKDLFDLVRGKEGIEQPIDTDVLTAIQLKRDGYDVIHLVDPDDTNNVVSVDLRHVTEESLLVDLKNRIEQADKDTVSYPTEKFLTDSWNVRNDTNTQFVRTQAAQRTFESLGHSPNNSVLLTDATLTALRVIERLTGRKVELGTLIGDPDYKGLARVNNGLAQAFLAQGADRFVAFHEIIGHHLDFAHTTNRLDPKLATRVTEVKKFLDTLPMADRAQVLDELIDAFVPPDSIAPDVRDAVRTSVGNFDEFMANFNAAIAFGLQSKSVYDNLRWMPEPIRRYVAAVFDWVKEVFTGMRITKRIESLQGLVGRDGVEAIDAFTKELNQAFKEDKRAVREMLRMDTVNPGGIWRVQDAGTLSTKDLGVPDKFTKLREEYFFIPKSVREGAERLLVPFVHKLEKYPALRNVQREIPGEQYQEMVMSRVFHADIYGERLPDGGVKIPKDGGPVGRITKSKEAQAAFSDLMLRCNKEGIDFLALEQTDPQTFAYELSRFPEKVRADVVPAVQKFQAAYKNAQLFIQDGFVKTIGEQLGLVLRNNGSKMTQDELRTLAHGLVETYRQYRVSGDPTAFNEMLAKGGNIDPEVVMLFVDPHFEVLGKMQQYWEKNPQYISERRMRRYLVSYNDGQEMNGMVDFDELDGAVKFAQEARDKGWKLFYPDSGVRDSQSKDNIAHRRDSFVDMFETSSEKTLIPIYDGLLSSGKITQETYDILTKGINRQRSALVSQMTQVAPTSVSKVRKFSPGREHLNMIDQHMMWLRNVSKYVPRQHTNAFMMFERHNPEISSSAENLRQFDDAWKQLDNFRTPDTKAGRLVSQMTFVHFLGANLSSMMIEATQFPLNLSPMLTSKGASVAQSYELPLRATNWIMNHGLTGTHNTGITVEGKDVGDLLLRDMDARGQIGLGQFQEISDIALQQRMDLTALGKGQKARGAQWLEKPLGAIMHLTSKLYGLTANYNDKIAIMSAFELLREQRLGGTKNLTKEQYDTLYADAVTIGKLATTGFGRVGRPTGWFDNDGTWRSVAMTTYALNSYNSGNLANLYNYLRIGFSKNLEGFTPTQKANAKKAATQAFATLIAVCGVMGIPFAGPIMRLVEDNSELELEKNMREFFDSLGDEESGPIIADFAMHGGLYAAGAPFDISSRVAPGGILGANAYEGWSPQALLGPAFSMGEQYAKAVKSALSGDVTQATYNALPAGFKRMFMMAANEGNIVSASGELMFTPTRSEQIANALGFNPRRATMMREMERIQSTQMRVQQAENKRVYKEASEIKRTQGGLAAQRYLLKMAQERPGFDVRTAARTVAAQEVNRKFGFEPRNVGGVQGGDETARFMQTFQPNAFQQTSNVDRVVAMATEMAAFGVQPRGLTNAIRQALMTDQIQSSGLPRATSAFLAQALNSGNAESLQSAQGFLPFLQQVDQSAGSR